MLGDLSLEFRQGIEEGERVVIRLAEYLDAPACAELLEECQHVWSIALNLFQHDAGERERDFELGVRFKKPEQERRGRQVGFRGDLAQQAAIVEIALAVIIEIVAVMADVEDAVTFQAVGLMYLQIEADRCHIRQVRVSP